MKAVSDAVLARRAALDGAGFHATFEAWAQDDISQGRLVSLFEDWLELFEGPYLYYPSRRRPPAALAAFVRFVREWNRSAGR